MLNAIAGSLVGYLLAKVGSQHRATSTSTKTDPGGQLGRRHHALRRQPDRALRARRSLAVVVGVAFWVLLNRTRFGFDLRATGQSETAAVASGVNVKRMVVISMLLSGAVAGLIGMPALFGDAHNYGSSFQTGLGFTGIAVALLGRNNPVGIAFGALLFAFLTEQANLLNILAGISPDIVAITQGVIVLAVVIAYEVVRRYRRPARAARGGRAAGRAAAPPSAEEAPSMSVATAGTGAAELGTEYAATACNRIGCSTLCAAASCSLSLVRVITGADAAHLVRHARARP